MQLLTGTRILVQSYESAAAMRSNYARIRKWSRPSAAPFFLKPTEPPPPELKTAPPKIVAQQPIPSIPDDTPIDLPNFLTRKIREPKPTVHEIQDAVCRRFGLSRGEINSNSRMARVVAPRHLAMALARDMTHKSFPEIGRLFGNRNHTTILHACNKIKSYIAESPEWSNLYAECRAEMFALIESGSHGN